MRFVKKSAMLLVILSASACATGNSFRAENRMKLLQLSPGMSKKEVLDVMGTGEQRVCCPIRTVTNPHRTEAYSAGGSRFEVLYYYTEKKTDSSHDPYSSNASNVQDDELLPIVLKDGKLEGWGWSFWNDTVNRYEIRIR
jgi:hypothetical protein